MRIFSLEFLIIFVLAFFIIFIKFRSKKVNTRISRKFIAIRGQQIIVDINKNVPLECLLEEGKNFGEDYLDKSLPELPHCENCECELEGVNHSSSDWFLDKRKPKKSENSDLGMLTKAEKRYYKYILISRHPEISQVQRKEFQDLAQQVSPVSEAFRMDVEAHLNDPNNPLEN
jgi:hypothetical protein